MTVADPDPTLADALGFPELVEAHADWIASEGSDDALDCASDLRAAAVRLREQDAEITRLRRICEPLDGNILQARLDKLDRIEAACADARSVADALIESGDLVVPTAAPAAVALLRRLADALEDTDG